MVPKISKESLSGLLNTISASMLVIAIFAVASMVSAYATASSTATPRTFSLVVADDVSQNALSAFIGAFIFSIVALIALQNGFYNKAGRFSLFVLTIAVFTIVIFTFVRWVDTVARLGRLGTTIDKVEAATAKNRPNPGWRTGSVRSSRRAGCLRWGNRLRAACRCYCPTKICGTI